MTNDQTVLLMGDIKCQHSEIVPIESLNLNPDNPNQHSEAQLEQYAKILQTGVRKPVRVSKRSNLVTVGHGHIQASLKNGWTHVPVEYQDYASEAEEYADMVADNALARQAMLDFSAINAKIPDFGPELDVALLGIANFTIEPFDRKTIENEWSGMPEFKHSDLTSLFRIIVHFESLENLKDFAKLIDQPLTESTKSIWFPWKERLVQSDKNYISKNK